MAHRYVGKHRQRPKPRPWPLVRMRLPGSLAACVVVASIASLVVLLPDELAVEASAGSGASLTAVRTARSSTRPRGAPIPRHVERFDLLVAGDLLIHSPILRRAQTGDGYDFRPMFAAIRPIVRRAALSICHVETPIGPGPPSSYPIFSAPEELAAAIRWTGFDACDTASNHTLDQGQQGVDDTLDALDRAGIEHAGSYRSGAESRRILMLSVRGVRIAFVAYTYGTNGLPIPHPWSVNLISPDRIRADASRARRGGADLVIVNFHWGTEYASAPNEQQLTLADTLLKRHTVDAIVGQHVHVVQPIEETHGRFVVFGEGNLISGQTADCCAAGSQDGLMAVLRVSVSGGEARVTGVDYIPTWVEHPDYTVLPVGQKLGYLAGHGQGQSYLAARLRASLARTITAAGRGPHVHPLLGTVRLR
jgi:hypothetical protein